MNLKNSISRLSWRFSNDKRFLPNDLDIEALNTVIKYVNNEEKRQYNNHHLFAKLYTYIYMEMLKKDGSTVYDTETRRKIHNLLRMPLSQIIEMFTDELNNSERYFMFDKAKVKNGVIPEKLRYINIDHIEDMYKRSELTSAQVSQKIIDWKNQKDIELQNVMRIYKTNPDAILGNVWKYEDVVKCIESEVNNAIVKFK